MLEKQEEGDFRGAVSLTCSEYSIMNNSEATIAALKSKHPGPHPEFTLPEVAGVTAITVNETDVRQAI